MWQHAAVRCGILQCVAVCYSVLHCVAETAVRCSELQFAAVCFSVLQCVSVCFSVLQCAAGCCSVLQCAALRESRGTSPSGGSGFLRVAVRRSVLQCAAACCSVLQYAAKWSRTFFACVYCVFAGYGVATISRLLKIIGLFCTISSLS